MSISSIMFCLSLQNAGRGSDRDDRDDVDGSVTFHLPLPYGKPTEGQPTGADSLLSLLSVSGSVSSLNQMILTSQNIHAIGRSGIGFNSAQLTLLGVRETSKGWLVRLIGTEIPDADYETLARLTGASRVVQKELVPERIGFWKADAPTSPKFDTAGIRRQFKHALNCLRAGEKLAAIDHVRAILAELENA